MTGDGPSPARRPAGTLVVLGTGAGTRDTHAAVDVLAGADAVFAGPPRAGADPESTVLFYAEAWRVECLGPREGAARLACWFDDHPGGTAVLATAGAPERDVAFGAAVEGLRRLRPALGVRRLDGVCVAPPERSPLPY